MAAKYLSAAGKRRRLYINTIKAFNELMANICRQKTSSDYFCHPTHILYRKVVVEIFEKCLSFIKMKKKALNPAIECLILSKITDFQ